MVRQWSSMARSDVAIDLPTGFALAEIMLTEGVDPHAAGRAAAAAALAQLSITAPIAYEGTCPIVPGTDARISITHGKQRALAVAARGVTHLGIDLADDDPRLPALAVRYFATEHDFANTPRELAQCFAIKEAALKALGLGLLDGGVFDDCVVRVVSLVPPRVTTELASLSVVVGSVPEGAVAIAFAR
jgi:hypothetical protein